MKTDRPTDPVARAFDSVDAGRRLDARPRRDAIERTHDAVRRSRLVDASGGRARETDGRTARDEATRGERDDSRVAPRATTVARPRRRTRDDAASRPRETRARRAAGARGATRERVVNREVRVRDGRAVRE